MICCIWVHNSLWNFIQKCVCVCVCVHARACTPACTHIHMFAYWGKGQQRSDGLWGLWVEVVPVITGTKELPLLSSLWTQEASVPSGSTAVGRWKRSSHSVNPPTSIFSWSNYSVFLFRERRVWQWVSREALVNISGWKNINNLVLRANLSTSKAQTWCLRL